MYTIDKKRFGVFVAELRKEKGLTQKDLAQALYVSDKAVSKWETGASIPDTALLIPLGELLGVSVTELLLCERRPQADAMGTEQVEDIVKTALSFTEEPPPRGAPNKRRWGLLYGLCLAMGLACLTLAPAALVFVLLGAVFGAYFCFFARSKLPAYHDEYAVRGVMDGVVRMNVPGLRFHNGNWPHILQAGRVWACLSMALLPLLLLLWPGGGETAALVLFLGGLFVPFYVVGKRYE